VRVKKLWKRISKRKLNLEKIQNKPLPLLIISRGVFRILDATISRDGMVNAQQFRADYPEFGSSTMFPSTQIEYWLNVAYSFLNSDRWGNQLPIGIELYVAHNLSLEAKAQLDAKDNGVPGYSPGLVIAKTVGPVGIKYENKITQEKDSGHWGFTIYGLRFIRMARLMGAGPMQIGLGSVPPFSGMGWNGPLATPGFTNFG
jgi:Protein of unknown function (DUF4054)